jgi:pSer/pThr/pTyr-binding forkhead associated (FHA) protein
MTPKLVHSDNGTLLGEILLDQERLTIGRNPDNDLQLEERSVSGRHARIIMVLGQCVVQDLNSRNGTFVNEQRIDCQALDDGDRIRIGSQYFTYVADPAMHRRNAGKRSPAEPKEEDSTAFAYLRVREGPKTGKKKRLSHGITPIGKSSGQLILIAKRPEGYFVTQVGGEDVPVTVNGSPLGVRMRLLRDGDVIRMGGVEFGFEDSVHTRAPA